MARRRRGPGVAALCLSLAGGLGLAGVAMGAGATPPAVASGDPLSGLQWGLQKIGAPTAWSVSTGRGVLIGIVDTGVDAQHEDLGGKVVASADCVGANGQPGACHPGGADDDGHGTHVAGIAAAVTGNGRGVAGTAPDSRLVVAKVLDSGGSGSIDDVDAGIEWVVDHGARVVNLSLGSDVPALSGVLGSSIVPGVEYAWQHGAVPVVAAGNQSLFALGGADYGNADALVVGATGPNDEVAGYSSPPGNAKWAVVAPGGDGYDSSGSPSCQGAAGRACIVSTWWSASDPVHGYAYLQGTSMATPYVSGEVALLLAAGLSPTQAVQRVLSTADHDVSCGPRCAGRIDAARALAGAGAHSASVGAPSGRGSAGRTPGTTGAGGRSGAGTAPAPGPGPTVAEPPPVNLAPAGADLPGPPPPTAAPPAAPTTTGDAAGAGRAGQIAAAGPGGHGAGGGGLAARVAALVLLIAVGGAVVAVGRPDRTRVRAGAER
ncbi:MAG TPA: S8 family serine peptidase [Acidimicrobiales bacterium]|nr:S8 family serine peptidase [Acidimicrobiales bacterium]